VSGIQGVEKSFSAGATIRNRTFCDNRPSIRRLDIKYRTHNETSVSSWHVALDISMFMYSTHS
jgi:hypothetical protein